MINDSSDERANGFQCSIFIPFQRIADLVCTGWEGGMYGSASWIDTAVVVQGGIKDGEPVEYSWEHPLYNGVLSLTYGEEENDTQTKLFNIASIRQGWRLFQLPANRHHFNDFMNENEDAITGDVFIQLCVLGEVVYG